MAIITTDSGRRFLITEVEEVRPLVVEPARPLAHYSPQSCKAGELFSCCACCAGLALAVLGTILIVRGVKADDFHLGLDEGQKIGYIVGGSICSATALVCCAIWKRYVG